jgi:hypothetical protein
MRRTPLRADPEKTRAWQERSRGKLKRKTPLSARSFSEVHADDPRYGPEFEALREMECIGVVFEYSGPGHETCGSGTQMLTKTAAHLNGRTHLCLPACGRMHDLIDGRGSERTVEAFRTWVAERPWRTLHELAEKYWQEVAE